MKVKISRRTRFLWNWTSRPERTPAGNLGIAAPSKPDERPASWRKAWEEREAVKRQMGGTWWRDALWVRGMRVLEDAGATLERLAWDEAEFEVEVES